MKGSKLSMAAITYIERIYKGYVVNVMVASKSGTPDLLACINGKFFAFEIKGTGDTKKALQDEKLKQIADAGGCGGYVHELKDIDRMVKNSLKPVVSTSKHRLIL